MPCGLSAGAAQMQMGMAGRAFMMRMGARLLLGGEHHQPTVAHAALGDHMIGQVTDIVRSAAQHAYFHAGIMVDIDMQ
jgi:hypothetical protein